MLGKEDYAKSMLEKLIWIWWVPCLLLTSVVMQKLIWIWWVPCLLLTSVVMQTALTLLSVCSAFMVVGAVHKKTVGEVVHEHKVQVQPVSCHCAELNCR